MKYVWLSAKFSSLSVSRYKKTVLHKLIVKVLSCCPFKYGSCRTIKSMLNIYLKGASDLVNWWGIERDLFFFFHHLDRSIIVVGDHFICNCSYDIAFCILIMVMCSLSLPFLWELVMMVVVSHTHSLSIYTHTHTYNLLLCMSISFRNADTFWLCNVLQGHLHTYRFCDNVWTFILQDALFKNEDSQENVGRVKIVACDSKLLTQWNFRNPFLLW